MGRAHEPSILVRNGLGHLTRSAHVPKAARGSRVELREPAGVLLEKVEDRRRRVWAHRVERLVDQCETQLGSHGLARLVGDRDRYRCLLARQKRLLGGLDRDLQFPLNDKVLGCTPQVAAIDDGRRESKIREQVVSDRDPEIVGPTMQLDNPVLEDRLPLLRHTRQALVEPCMEPHF